MPKTTKKTTKKTDTIVNVNVNTSTSLKNTGTFSYPARVNSLHTRHGEMDSRTVQNAYDNFWNN